MTWSHLAKTSAGVKMVAAGARANMDVQSAAFVTLYTLVLFMMKCSAASAAADTHIFVEPIAGPASGGTVLMLTLPSRCNASSVCLFGGAASAMGYNSSGNASRWECSAPSALAAGAAAVSDADALLQNASLTGSASRRSNNTIELTHTRGYNHVGSLIGDPPLSSETAGSSNVMVEFELLVGRGTGGDGFSVSLAPVHSRVANYDERGVAEGLALSFRSIAGLLFVQFRGEQLLERRLDGRSTFECDNFNCANCAQSSRCLMAGCEWIDWQGRCTAGLEQKRRHTFRTHSFVPVRVLVVDERLSVWHDGHAYVSGLHIPNWEALSRAAPWHVVFGARVSIHVDDHWIRSLRVSQGAVVGSAPTRLSVADDTCNLSGLQYEYYASPIVSHLGQLQGPLNGGTRVQVFGDHLGRGTQRQLCRFGASKVSASRGLDGTLECDSPRFGSPGVVTVEVSLNGVDFTMTVPAPTFMFTDPQLLTVQPNVTLSGTGPVLLTLTGRRLGGGSKYLCRFNVAGNFSFVPAFVDFHRQSLFCTAPSLEVSNASQMMVGVEVTLNGVDYTDSGSSVMYLSPPVVDSVSPAIGPTHGGTRVVVHGAFDARPDWSCLFGRARVVASVLNGSMDGPVARALACVAPGMRSADTLALSPALVAHLRFAPAEVAARRNVGQTNYELRGHARIRFERLVLTHDAPNQLGSCVLAYPRGNDVRPSRASAFSAAFDVQVSGVCLGEEAVCGGTGVSLSFGELPDEAFGSEGAGNGLRVQLLTFSRRVFVSYGGAMVTSAQVAKDLRARAPQQVEVRYTANGLWMRYDEQVVIDGVRIDAWAPQASWRFGFGARTGAESPAHNEHAVDNVRIELGDMIAAEGLSLVRVGLNAMQLSAALQYTYLSPVHSVSISPASGPREGGTVVTIAVSAMSYSVDLRCSLNGTVVPASARDGREIVCTTPPAVRSGQAIAAVTINGADYSAGSLLFMYQEIPIVQLFFPLSAPVRGGSIVRVTGRGFADGTQPRCRFGVFGTTSASVLDAANMLCHSPSAETVRSVPLEIALNAQQYTSHGHHFSTFFPPVVSSLSPIQGPVGGGTRVLVAGVGFDTGNASVLACHIGETRVEAVLLNRSVIVCNTTALSRGLHCIEISLNGQDITSSCVRFAAVPQTTVTSLVPNSGPVVGSTQITMQGVHLAGGADYRCRFVAHGEVVRIAASFEASTSSVVCFSPVWNASHGTQELSVAINGQQYTDPVAFEVFGVPVVSSISPASGPVGGATVVQIFGANLGGGLSYVCAFGMTLVTANMVSASVANCSAPATGSRGGQLLRLSLNAQQFEPGHEFSYYTDAALSPSSVSPTCGPNSGATVVIVSSSRSLAGGSHYECSFGSAGRVPANFSATEGSVTCVSPSTRHPPGRQLFSIYLNGQQLAVSNASFTFTGEPRIVPPSPRSGPVHGGTLITLDGVDLANGSHYVCLCEGITVPASYHVGQGAVRCETPPSQRQCDAFARCRARTGNTTCRVSLNGQQFTREMAFYYHESPRASHSSPSCGPVHGGTAVQISGTGFANGTRYECAFGPTRVAASASIVDGTETLRCTLPQLLLSHATSIPLSVSLNGQQFSSDVLSFSVAGPPHLTSIEPEYGQESGGTLVEIRGENISAGCDYRCSFGHEAMPCELLGGALLSRIPIRTQNINRSANDTLVRVTLNGQQYSEALSFGLYRPMRISAVSPTSGPVRGETTIRLSGEHFHDSPLLRCRIGSVFVVARHVNESQIECVTPSSSSSSGAMPALFRLTAEEAERADAECYTSSRAVDYVGNVANTRQGHRCQNWMSQSPHLHDYNGISHPGAGLGDHNFCRNPAGQRSSAWCFTVDPDTRWALCNVGLPLESCRRRLLLAGNATAQGQSLILAAGRSESGYAEVPVNALVRADEQQVPVFQEGLWLELDVLVGAPVVQSHGEQVPVVLHADGMLSAFCIHYGGWGEVRGEHGIVYLDPGLTVRLITRGAFGQVLRPRLEVLVNGREVHSVLPEVLNFMGGSFRTMVLRITAERQLTIQYDGVILVSNLLVAGLVPAHNWRVRFAARNGAIADDVHAIDNVRALGLSGHRPAVVNVDATLGLQDFTDGGVEFEYVASTTISSCSPSSGPAQGGTHIALHGSGLRHGPDMRCRFDDVQVPASALVGERIACHTPAMPPSDGVTVEVTINGQDYAASAVTYLPYPPPHVSYLSLEYGPTSGGTVILVHGSGAGARTEPSALSLSRARSHS